MALHFRDRTAFPWQLPAVVVLVALLATLATFQYRWLGEVSEAERSRMRESLRTRATDFTQEFDRELTRIYLGFHVDSDQVEKDPGGTLADALARTVLSLPLSHEHDDAEIDAVIDAVRGFFGGR